MPTSRQGRPSACATSARTLSVTDSFGSPPHAVGVPAEIHGGGKQYAHGGRPFVWTGLLAKTGDVEIYREYAGGGRGNLEEGIRRRR